MCNYNEFYKINEEFKVIKCEECGFWHVYPYPDDEILDTFYKKDYSDNLKKHNLFRKVNYFKNKKIDNILDIGCGNGELLDEFKKHDFKTYGIEPSEKASLNAKKNHEVINSSLKENLFERKFNLISLNFVLEHVKHPYNFIKNILNNFLEEDGYLLIEIPNDFNELQIIYHVNNHLENEIPYWIHFPVHLNYWNFNTFSNFIEKLNLKIVFQTSSYPLEMFLLYGDDYIKDSEKGSTIHKKRLNFEENIIKAKGLEYLSDFYTHLSKKNIGRTIEVILERV